MNSMKVHLISILALVAIAGCVGQTQSGPVHQTGVEVGDRAADFSFVEVNGGQKAISGLRDKPLFIFFTTSYCVPCQIGARELARYDAETGDGAFDVLVVFVDPRETPDQLKAWGDRFGRPDWLLALDGDGSIAASYQVRYLDTKYVLDKDGAIRWKDTSPLTYEAARSVLAPLLQVIA